MQVSKSDVEADLVELHFKDTYLTRADMWRISSSLIGKCVYFTQRHSYCDVVRPSIQNIFKKGHKTFSAYVGPSTKLVYRSESARMIYFIQMSSEMWNFVENGEVMFHKLVNSFLPEVFKRWRDQGAHHVVSIVLFTSVAVSRKSRGRLAQGEREPNTRDYFRVVVDQVHISKWNNIMATLRYEFARFAKDVLQSETGEIRGTILPAVKGNLLEAISFATSLVSSKFADRDLRRTGIQVLIVTPGTGIYDVDYNLLYQTSMKLLAIEIGIDLVCLSRPPLHVTPLFRYKNEQTGQVVNCIPSWLDISFWNSTETHAEQWIPRCKIYDIQMMGIMENEINAISIEWLNSPTPDKSLRNFMKDYDNSVYLSKAAISSQRLIEEAASTKTPSSLLRPKISSSEMNNRATSNQTLLRSVSLSIPATAIISSPAVEGNSSKNSTELLNNTMKRGTRISALTSLLSLGGYNTKGSRPSSPVIQPTTASQSIGTVSSLSDIQDIPSLSSGSTAIESTSSSRSVSTGAIPRTSSKLNIFAKAIGSNNNNNTVERTLSVSPSHSQTSRRPTLGSRQGSYNRGTMRPSTSPTTNSSSTALVGQESSSQPASETETVEGSNNYVWVVIDNPSNVAQSSVLNISNFGRWRNVFPPGVKRRAVKWRSLKSPAALPLATDLFPSVEEFAKKYTFQIYDVTLDAEKEDIMTPGDLLEEMVALRLHIGFQIVVGDRVSKVEAQRRPGGNPALIVQTIPEDYRGIRLYLKRSNQIHRLACDHYGTINVQLYTKADSEDLGVERSYHPLIKTRFESEYKSALGNFFNPGVRIVNWNGLDQTLAGYGDMMQESYKMFRIRFVLIPFDNVKSSSSSNAPVELTLNNERMTAEEMRLEGLKRIINTLYRGRYLTPEEKRLRKNIKKETSAPEIKFYTGDLGTFLLQLYEDCQIDATSDSTNANARKKNSFISKPNERLNRSIKLTPLAVEMQGERGIRFIDRRWHWKTHKNCFMGQEFVTWLIESFTDIFTVEEAIEYGNQLMKNGLFKHVEDRHSFLDGHYFYQVLPEFIVHPEKDKHEKVERSGWFSSKRSLGAMSDNSGSGSSVTPMTSGGSGNSTTGTIGADGSMSSASSQVGTSGAGGAGSSVFKRLHSRKPSGSSPVDDGQTGMIPILSRDSASSIVSNNTGISGANSENTEIPSADVSALPKILVSQVLKYDVDPTGRSRRQEFISVHIDKVHNPENAYHLRMEWLNTTPKLIEEAIVSLSRVGDRYGLRLVQVPMEEISALPNDSPFCSLLRCEFAVCPAYATQRQDPLYYQKYFLKKNNFVLDTHASSSLMKKEVEIQYSWGKPFYNFSQYIHETGTILAQIVGDGTFVFLINALQVSRTGIQIGPNSSLPSAKDLMLTMKAQCDDPVGLVQLFEEANKNINEET
ncbi:Iml1p [Sugiyamaella lignohabitans]|uniref:Vacuolar membrane-associated protein IML1 n=1 Tax=Sugiyamaella lignohabitans TaxID=796027 RepID=A0A167CZG2_9ASCO|nr:Iml1p [Sugiyamaella lignohabitans]ANB12291.1 Iml1p [Sugiyamaella lignohabitans]